MSAAIRVSLAWVSWYSPTGAPKTDAVLGVVHRSLVGGLHDADRSSRGLESTVLEACHLVVEAAALALGASDQVFGRNEPLIERQLVGMHAAVAKGVDRSPFHRAAARLAEGEAVTVAALLGHDQDRQAAVAQAAVGVGADQQHEHVGTSGEGAPGLDPVDRASRRRSWWPTP